MPAFTSCAWRSNTSSWVPPRSEALREACAVFNCVCARAAWARASASSSTISNWPFLTESPSLTRTRRMLVAAGAWASKLLTGSIFPFVEIRLRIELCSTTAVRTATESSRRETNAASTMTAARIASAVTHQRRGWSPELFPFNGMQRKTQFQCIIHALRDRKAIAAGTYLFRCSANAVCFGYIGWLPGQGDGHVRRAPLQGDGD